ncbi:ABC transporter substrate-binding protein [Metabacillus halosaccharovorans]|uniref:ABC transporter substrate-binding protein n=1 Tax=Metabacillus halosaccharovorans TaxID=930124 RepID=UPI000994EA65|nr:sugar ABC transporter substrate-binding protein [Metabacillus halosaccharovorans]
MKKKSLLSFLCGIMALLLVACSGGQSSSGGAEETKVIGDDVENATELTFWSFNELHLAFFEDAVPRWNEANPDKPIKLKAEVYPFDNMHTNLLMALQSGKGAPDIADIEIGKFPNFLKGEPQILPMNDYIEPEFDNFVTSRFEIYSKDGNYYGLPTHVGASVMYYNKEIMDAAGVDIESIKTWEDFREAGKQVVAKTDAIMTSVSTEDYIPYWSMISQRDSDFFNKDGELTIYNEENVDTLQYLHDIVYEDKIAEVMPGAAPHAEEFYQFMNDGGQAAIGMPMWYMGRFLDYMPDLKGKIVVRPMPAWEEGGKRSAGMGGTGTVVTNQSENPELAQEFLAFAKLSKEANIKLWTVLGFDPPRHDVWESEEVLADNQYYQYFGHDLFDTLNDIKDEINAVNITEYTPDVGTEINTNVFNNVLRQQSETADEALKKAQETVESKMN